MPLAVQGLEHHEGVAALDEVLLRPVRLISIARKGAALSSG